MINLSCFYCLAGIRFHKQLKVDISIYMCICVCINIELIHSLMEQIVKLHKEK